VLAYILKGYLKYSQTRVDLVIEGVSITFSSEWLVERIYLVEMLKAGF